jgi:hypothetical protein
MLLAWGSAVHAEGFGRWETGLQSCTLQQGVAGLPQPAGPQARPQNCARLRLEQNLEGLLSVRLITPSGIQHFSNRTLVFGGVLAPGQAPMRCSSDGECKPRWPIRLDVATVASNLVTNQDPAPTLPRARLAKGTCLLERRALACQARDQNGQVWEAKARF